MIVDVTSDAGRVSFSVTKLEVTSRPGEGTTFEFDLPRATLPMSPAPRVAPGGRG